MITEIADPMKRHLYEQCLVQNWPIVDIKY